VFCKCTCAWATSSPWISCQCTFCVLAYVGSHVQSKVFMIKSIHRDKHCSSKRKNDNLHFHKIWYIKKLINNASIKTTIMKIPGDKWFPHPTLLVAYLQSSSFPSVFKNNLSMKEGCLFCLSLWDLQITGPLAALLGVHQVGFIMFQPIVEKLLNIQNFHWTFIQIKSENYKGFWVHCWYCWENP
jgi:hypothetical protein